MARYHVHVVGQDLWKFNAAPIATEVKVLSLIWKIKVSAYRRHLMATYTYSYYYLVQTQIFVVGVDYCDFCICTFSKMVRMIST